MPEQILEQIAREGRDHLRALQPARIAVLLSENGGNLTARKLHEIELDQLFHRSQLFELVQKTGAGVLIANAESDRRFARLSRYLSSALCVPITTRAGRVLGVLLAESDQTGWFTQDHLQATEEVARSLGERLAEARMAARAAPPPISPRPALKVGPLAALVLAAGLLGYLLKGDTGATLNADKTPPTGTPAVVNAPPEVTPNRFLGSIRLLRFAEAHQLLSPRLQRELPLKRFEKELRGWLGSRENRSDIARRRAVLSKADAETAAIVVDAGETGGKPWSWALLRQGHDWRIDRLEGGPWG